ncbi:MAG: ATP-grasp domain-containing protein [Gemmatimonadales bacterium]
MATRVLIAGLSTRAFAESAARAGYDVTAVDAFGDLDLRARVCRTIALERGQAGAARFSARAAVRAARDVACDAVAYAAGLENHPRAVAALAATRALWGNPPAVLARVRDPLGLARALRQRGFATPDVRVGAGARGRWLLKPRASGGGHGIVPWLGRRGTPRVPPTMYLQERIAGVAGSIVFAADGMRAVPLGLSRALAGERAFGAHGFGYCGNILAGAGDGQFTADARLFAAATALATAVTAEFGLVGVNGIDFVARRGVPYAVEVNPRYTASMELVERAYGLSMFDIHARACAGALPAFDLAAARAAPGGGAIGKAIVYARRSITVADTRGWQSDCSVRDVPAPHERIARGRPVCTVFARGRDGADCYAALNARAVALYRLIEPRSLRIA